MLIRLLVRVFAAAILLAAVWGLGAMHESGAHVWIRPVGAPRGPVRILQFYANVGTIVAGEKARLCYGVENAKAVHISPLLPDVAPAANRCLEIVPERTTHYAILAEGFDGNVATRFFTLVVQTAPDPPREMVNFAMLRVVGLKPPRKLKSAPLRHEGVQAFALPPGLRHDLAM